MICCMKITTALFPERSETEKSVDYDYQAGREEELTCVFTGEFFSK